MKEPIYPGATVTQGQGLLAVILFILCYHPTVAREDLMALLNVLIPNKVFKLNAIQVYKACTSKKLSEAIVLAFFASHV